MDTTTSETPAAGKKAKRDSLIRQWNATIRAWEFVDRTTKTVVRSYPESKLPDAMKEKTYVHGGFAKVGDAGAASAGVPMATRLASMDSVWTNLCAGNWDAVRETLTPEQKFEILRAAVYGAYVSLRKLPHETEKQKAAALSAFNAYVARSVANTAAAGGKTTTDVVITAMRNTPDISAEIARLDALGVGLGGIVLEPLS